jgi:hypothetical protein
VFGVLPISHFLAISFPTPLFLLTSAFQTDLYVFITLFCSVTGVSNTQPAISFYSALSSILLQLEYSKYPSTLTDTVLELPSVTGSSRLPSLEGNVRHMSA